MFNTFYLYISIIMKRRTYVKALAGTTGLLGTPIAGVSTAASDGRGRSNVALDSSDRETITEFLESHVDEGTFPGAAVSVVTDAGQIYRAAVGDAQTVPVTRELTADTVFDLASLTKAVATTTSVLQLIDRGELGLRDPIREFYPEIPAGDEKREITVRHLLTHTSGLPAWLPLWREVDDPADAVEHVLREVPLDYEPGSQMGYSDLGFVLLGDLVERVSGAPLDEYATANVFEPLGMASTAFEPSENLPADREYAATEDSAYHGGVVVGEVHDENASFLGGVSGHAGLFSTVDDLSTFAAAVLGDGETDGERVLSKRAVRTMTRPWTPDLDADRGLGWDRRELFGETERGAPHDRNAFGHTGFTGTSLWFSPRLDLAVVALTNRVHPTRENYAISSFRPEFHELIASLAAD